MERVAHLNKALSARSGTLCQQQRQALLIKLNDVVHAAFNGTQVVILSGGHVNASDTVAR